MTRTPSIRPVLRWMLCLGLLMAAAPAALQAQQVSDTVLVVRLVDGSTVIGRVVEATAEHIVVETSARLRMTVPRGQIADTRPATGRIVDGEYWFEDPNHTRLLVMSPTGRTLQQGEGYLSAFWVVFPFVAYGVTDHFTIAAGTPLIPDAIMRIAYLAPKLRVFSAENTAVSVGVLSIFNFEDLSDGTLGIGYGVGTVGSTDRSLTAGIGWGYYARTEGVETTSRPVVMLGGDVRVARTVKLVSENMFVPGEIGTMLSGGVRFFGERIAVDLGIAGFREDNRLFWFPTGNFVYNLRR